MSDVAERVKKTVAGTLELSEAETGELKPDSGVGNVRGWDSANHINVILDIEDEFGIQFDEEKVAGLTTIQAVTDAVSENC